MQPLQKLTLEESLNLMIMLGLYQPVGTMIRDYPYKVMHVIRSVHEIFLLLEHNFIDEFRLIQLPQRLHETFRRLLVINSLNNVNQFYLEYVGDTADGEPILHAYGSGFSTYV
jgi:hypothetical protein